MGIFDFMKKKPEKKKSTPGLETSKPIKNPFTTPKGETIIEEEVGAPFEKIDERGPGLVKKQAPEPKDPFDLVSEAPLFKTKSSGIEELDEVYQALEKISRDLRRVSDKVREVSDRLRR